MNCMTGHVGKTVLLLSMLMSGCTNVPTNPTTVHTTNKDAAWHKQFLKTRMGALQREGDGVRLTVTTLPSSGPLTEVVPIGHTLVFPDHHGPKNYTIASIVDDGVVFQYKYSFDHRSFGKNLIETDEGSFLLEWTAQAASPVTSAEDAAVKKALAYLAESDIDTSRHDSKQHRREGEARAQADGASATAPSPRRTGRAAASWSPLGAGLPL